MRVLVLILLVAAQGVFAQNPAQSDAGDCNVVAHSVEVNEDGRFERPAPSPEECLIVSELESKFLNTDRGEFVLLRRMSRAPETVRVFVGRISDFGERGVVTWVSPELAVIVYREAEFGGATISVLLADLTSLEACLYRRWPDSDVLASPSIAKIKRVLEAGKSARGDPPICYLSALTLD